MTELITYLTFWGHMVWACGIIQNPGALVDAVRYLRLKTSFQ